MVHDALGTAKFLIEGDKLKEARQVLDIVYPFANTIEQLDAIGLAYSQAKGWDKCADIAMRIYTIIEEPHKSLARESLINAYLNLNRPNDALKLIEEQEKISYRNFIPLTKSMSLFMLNRKQESENILRSALKDPSLENQHKNILFNLATHDFANGNFKEGLKNFLLTGREIGLWKKVTLPVNQYWSGSLLPKDTKILIIAEGGIGDEFINFRFCENLKQLGYKPYWYTDRLDLAEVFERHNVPCFTNYQQISQEFNSDWKWIYSMCLPISLDLSEDQLWKNPYLTPSIPKKSSDTFKIGIRTQGNPEYEHNLHRSIPTEDLTHALNIHSFNDIYNFNEDGNMWPLVSDNWENTLNYLHQMDVVITSCTSIAHASAAMGKKTLVLVPIMNYYIWAKPGNNSPWYGDNVILFRQIEPNSWTEPILEVLNYLDNLL